MTMMSRIILTTALIGCGVSSGSVFSAPQGTITVQVADGANHRSIREARVFILGGDGKELAVSTTDARGLAHLPLLPATVGAKYVLVERPAYFISGMAWQPDQEEYYILVTLLRLP
jgi:hypothetical protein